METFYFSIMFTHILLVFDLFLIKQLCHFWDKKHPCFSSVFQNVVLFQLIFCLSQTYLISSCLFLPLTATPFPCSLFFSSTPFLSYILSAVLTTIFSLRPLTTFQPFLTVPPVCPLLFRLSCSSLFLSKATYENGSASSEHNWLKYCGGMDAEEWRYEVLIEGWKEREKDNGGQEQVNIPCHSLSDKWSVRLVRK